MSVFPPIVRYIAQYCIGFDNRVHTTVYDLMFQRNPDEAHKKADAALNRSPMAFWVDEGTVPADQIQIYISPMGGSSAD